MTGAPSSPSISPIQPSLLLPTGSASSQWHDDFTTAIAAIAVPRSSSPISAYTAALASPSPSLAPQGPAAAANPHLSANPWPQWRLPPQPKHSTGEPRFNPWLVATNPSLPQELLHRLRAWCLARRPRLLDSHGGMTKLEVPGAHPWLEVEDKADVWGPRVSE